MARLASLFAAIAASAGGICTASAAQPLTEEQARAIIAPWYFETALTWPEAQQRIQALLERGLQREVDFENRWPEVLGTLVET